MISGFPHSSPAGWFKGWYALMAGAALVLVAILVALSLSLGLWPIGAIVAGLVFWLAVFTWATRQDRRSTDLVFWLLFGLTLTVGFVQKRTGTSVGIVLEGVMLLTLPFAVWSLGHLDRSLRRLFMLLPLFLCISVLSAIFGQSPLGAAGFQIATDLKFVVLLLTGLYVSWSETTERRFWTAVRWLWLPMLLLVAWQWVSPSTYFTYLHTSYGGQDDPLGLVPTRALGPYNHSAQFAAVLALLCLISLVRGSLTDRSFFLVGAFYFAMLLATTQRVEIGSAVLMAAILYLKLNADGRRRRSVWAWPALAIVVVGALLAAGPLVQERLERDVEYLEFTGDAQAFRPRPVYYLTSMQIANTYAPLGSGPGTFAGAGAGKFNWDYYQKLGFFGYSWFSPMYMFETYWPHFIGEDGWGGFLAYLLFVVGLILYSFRRADAEGEPVVRGYWLIAGCGLGYLLLTSLNGPTFEDPETAFFAAMFFGVAYRHRLQKPLVSNYLSI